MDEKCLIKHLTLTVLSKIVADDCLNLYYYDHFSEKIRQGISCDSHEISSLKKYPRKENFIVDDSHEMSTSFSLKSTKQNKKKNKNNNKYIKILSTVVTVVMSFLTLVLLNPDMPWLCKQWRSRSEEAN